ncbi:acyltransferase [Streptomyces sp. Je 1-4]|uniref:acyltransferase n=1 Tax=Streptomyces TaxID=1883 RepID=UPI0021D9B525|nr:MULTISPECIES: acyltransferase [unclassified Streptomyces]UYB40816.1 acyltransferase [Streptomyces sp. Je 1-4]UZQ36970.1 acyltransferase [Streptomyces sp. Je 1-4] [Streptomyces sp. Je 1-4 4N24]UZQ44387.1 acyltransferase [Streptomyces sp. Je 1-4] [Streptomyces sp. Je 1-4 4N24_ara]
MTDLELRPPSPVRQPPLPTGPLRPRPARRTPWQALHTAALRIDAATPAERDRAIDVLRALAIAGVVLGHWLVSGVVLQAGGHLVGDSPLGHLPGLAPVTWILQPLAVFFLVGGRVSARSYATAQARGIGYRTWLGRRLARLLRPATAFALTWGLVWLGLVLAGTAHETIHTLMWLAYSPLWFLGVYALLIAATPLVHKAGGRIAVAACLVVAALDASRVLFADSGWPDTLRLLNIPAGWLVPYCLGAVWAAGGFSRSRPAVALLLGGGGAMAALILWGGYPASMVGVPGSTLSNLSPPTLAVVAFGLAQAGAALLLRGPLRRAVTVPAPTGPAAALRSRATSAQFLWAAVALLNLSAVTVFLWHQTAMLTTTVIPLGLGHTFPGLHTSPDSLAWIAARSGWIAVFVVVLLVLGTAFRDREGARGNRAIINQ